MLKWRIAHDGKARFQQPEYVFGYADVHLARNDYCTVRDRLKRVGSSTAALEVNDAIGPTPVARQWFS